jgi:hypothetical protein
VTVLCAVPGAGYRILKSEASSKRFFFEKSATPSDSYYFFADIDVSKHILVLDTSILAKNNMNNVFVCRKTLSHCIFGRTYRIVKKES